MELNEKTSDLSEKNKNLETEQNILKKELEFVRNYWKEEFEKKDAETLNQR